MDPNRPINRAAQVCKVHIFLEDPKFLMKSPSFAYSVQNLFQGDPDAELAYNEFHDYILKAREAMNGPGLLVDFHGVQSHPHNRIEIGYLFR